MRTVLVCYWTFQGSGWLCPALTCFPAQLSGRNSRSIHHRNPSPLPAPVWYRFQRVWLLIWSPALSAGSLWWRTVEEAELCWPERGGWRFLSRQWRSISRARCLGNKNQWQYLERILQLTYWDRVVCLEHWCWSGWRGWQWWQGDSGGEGQPCWVVRSLRSLRSDCLGGDQHRPLSSLAARCSIRMLPFLFHDKFLSIPKLYNDFPDPLALLRLRPLPAPPGSWCRSYQNILSGLYLFLSSPLISQLCNSQLLQPLTWGYQ